jgi:uncharacterized protein (TIGR02453 family)
MPRAHPIDHDLYPPFTGFPAEGLRFLRRLKKNNTRTWFTAHREEYEELVHFPMECLIATVADLMRDAAPEVEFHPRKSIFRIYRDVRFSRNKAPYKTNIAASFPLRGRKGPTESPGLYVGVEPGEIFIGGGLYMPMGAQLKAIRASVANAPGEFLGVVRDSTFRKLLGGIQGERLQRAPLGYPPDHPMIEYLRYKQWFAGVTLDDEACLKPTFARRVVRVFAATMPLVRWLGGATSGAREPGMG